MGNEFAEITALCKEVFWVGLLKVVTTELTAWYLRRDRNYGNTAAVAVIEPVDQVQVAWTATSSARRQGPGQMSFRSCGKGSAFFVPNGHPVDVRVRADRFGDTIKRVASQPVDPLHSGCHQSINQQMCHCFLCHYVFSALYRSAETMA
jgi:hypothetical protein